MAQQNFNWFDNETAYKNLYAIQAENVEIN